MSDEAAKEEDRTGPITDEEARQILSRYNASHWYHTRPTGRERARYSIPADPKRDDDIRLDAYISQTRTLRAENARLRSALEGLAKTACAYAGSFDSCADAVDDQDYEGPCPRCVARTTLTPSPRDGG